jgi:hypothetical protein
MEARMVRVVRRSLILTVGSLVALGLFASVGPAAAYGISAPFGFSTPTGSFVLPYYQALLDTPSIIAGGVVFGDTVYLEFLNSLGNRTVVVSVVQGSGNDTAFYNATFSAAAHNVTIWTLTLPSTTTAKTAKICLDGACMRFVHVTPLTLLPSGILNVGGLDILAFGLTAEFGLLLFPLTVAARALTRKALWTPKFKAWLVAPHIALGFLLLVAFDYQAFDTLFGGFEFVLIPVVFAFVYFLWVLHLFNVATPVEVLRFDPQGGHRVRGFRSLFWVGKLHGSTVAIGPRWRDWLARLFGHAPVVIPANVDGTKVGPPAVIPLTTVRTEATRERLDRRAKALRRAFRARGQKETPLDDFVLEVDRADIRERDPPTLLYFVDTDGWLELEYPHLTMHRVVRVPPKLHPETGAVVEPATTRRKLTWPHYTDTTASAGLAAGHYVDTIVAAMLLVSNERAYRRMGELRIENNLLKSTVYVEADASGALQSADIYRTLDDERLGLTDDEAEEETRREAAKAKPEPDAGTVESAEESSREGARSDRRAREGVRP